MVEISEAIRIDCPPAVVWAALADFGAISQWAPNVEHSSLTTNEHQGVGAERRVQVGRNALLEMVTAWDPETRLSYAIKGLPAIVRSAVNTWSLEGGDNTTTVTLTSQIDSGPRPPQQVACRVVAKVMSKASIQMLDGLKAHLETAS